VPVLISGEKKLLFPTISKFNKSLETSVYVLGNNISLADVVVFPCFHSILVSWDEDERSGRFVDITRWYDHLQHIPILRGKVDFLKVEINQNVPKAEPKKKQQQPPKEKKKQKQPEDQTPQEEQTDQNNTQQPSKKKKKRNKNNLKSNPHKRNKQTKIILNHHPPKKKKKRRNRKKNPLRKTILQPIKPFQILIQTLP